MAIVWALLAAFSFGSSDLVAREATRREGIFRSQFYLSLLSGVPLLVAHLVFGSPEMWGRIFSFWGLVCALITVAFTFGGLLLYRALATGPLLIVSPVISSMAAVTTIFAVIGGERPELLQLIGIVVTITGVVFAATAPPDPAHEKPSHVDNAFLERLLPRWMPPGVALAIGVSLIFGFCNFLIGFVVREIGPFPAVMIQRVVATILLIGYMGVSRRAVHIRQAGTWKFLLVLAVLDTGGVTFFNLGLSAGLTSIVTVITSLFSVVTVILGYLFFHERITPLQAGGILVTFVGVALVSI
ncbi:MAG: DMT family transporter [Anaerolineae bacterium]|nr:DMT family transporter [Anaerolineae bacterium]